MKSKALLEVEIIFCQFEGSFCGWYMLGIILVYLLHLLIDLDILAMICWVFLHFFLHSILLFVLSFPVLMEVYQPWRTSWAAILGGVEWSVCTRCWMLSSWNHC